MALLRPARPLVLTGALLVTVALAGCSTGGDTAASASTSTATATDPADAWAATPAPASIDEDRSAPAVCGQLSALGSIGLNASDGLQRGALTQEQYEALIAAERFGYERLSSTDAELDDALDYAHEYLDAHPAPASGPALDDSADWDLVARTLNAACRAAGSNIVVSAQYGG